MSLRYYMDQHVHASITKGLRARGIDCVTAEEDGAKLLPDDRLLQRAADLGRVTFSQDVDLLNIAALWIGASRPFAGLVFAHQLGITIGQAIGDLQLIAQVISPEEIRNSILWLPV